MKIAGRETGELSWEVREKLPEGHEQTSDPILLVVDSDFDRQEQTSAVLRSAGYSVLSASSAEEGIATFDANPGVGLVITRVILQSESGVQLANHVRKSERDAETLLVSHFSRDLLRHVPGFTEHGNFLPNPFTEEGLLTRVRRLIHRRY